MVSGLELQFIIIWVAPIFSMWLFYVKSSFLDNFYEFIAFTNIIFCVGLYFVPVEYNRLLMVYGFVFLVLYSIQHKLYGWGLTQAFSVSSVVILTGSYLWESPWLIRNAVLVGFEPDWILHLMVVFFIWFLKKTVGFSKNISDYLAIIGCLVVSTFVMLQTNIPPKTYGADVWDVGIFFGLRVFGALAVFDSVNTRNVLMEEGKSDAV